MKLSEKREKILDTLSWQMVDYLDTLPDMVDTCTTEMLIKACGAQIGKDEVFQNTIYVIEETVIEGNQELTRLDELFKANAEVRGYIFDDLSTWHDTSIIPYDITFRCYRKEALLQELSSRPSIKFIDLDENVVYIKEMIKDDEKIDNKRVIQLVTIPAGEATGPLDIKYVPMIVYGIKGAGEAESYKHYLDVHTLGTDNWMRGVEQTHIDEHVQLYTISERQPERAHLRWLDILNEKGQDEMVVLIIRRLDTWLSM